MPVERNQTLSHYRLIEKIGEGGMGVVWKAEDTTLKRPVALKFLTEKYYTQEERKVRFLREARLAAALNHPNICTVYEVAEIPSGEEQILPSGERMVPGNPYIAMEFIEGRTLRDDLLGSVSLPLEDLLRIGVHISEGLAVAHAKRIVHRDLKPSNVMLTADGRAKVLDFGLAKPLEPAEPGDKVMSQAETISAELTREGMVVGTAAYMSPEQAKGEKLDSRSDVFSFGIMLYEMVAGVRPFWGDTPSTTRLKIIESEPKPLPDTRTDVPPDLERIIRRCLKKKPDERYNDTRDLVAAMKDLREETSSGRQRRLSDAQAVPTGLQTSPTQVAAGRTLVARWAFVATGVVLIVPVVFLFAKWPVISPTLWGGAAVPTGAPARLSIHPPANLRLGGFRISPDGTIVVYRAFDKAADAAEQEWALYTRRLDRYEDALVPNSEGVNVWNLSPDGRWLGFAAPVSLGSSRRHLYKVPLDGSAPPQRIADWPENMTWGILWLPNDDIVGLTERPQSILRFPADGGAPGPPVEITGELAGLYILISALPEGRHVLADSWVTGEESGRTNVWLLDTETGSTNLLLEGSEYAHWSPTGHLLFSRGDALLGAPFDLDRLELTDGPFTLLDGLYTTIYGSGWFSLSNNGTLVYRPGGATEAQRRLVFVDRDGQVQGPWSSDRRAFRSVSVSPNGRRMGTQITSPQNGLEQIWVSDMDQPRLRPLVAEPGMDCYSPIWMPAGDRLVYCCADDADGGGIYIRSVDRSGDPELLLAREVADVSLWPTSVSPDGLTLLLDRYSAGISEILLLPLDPGSKGGQTPRSLITDQSKPWGGSFSPDGRIVAYNSDETGRSEMYIREFRDNGTVGPALLVTGDGAWGGQWSRNEVQSSYDFSYLLGTKYMSVAITTSPRVHVSEPRLLVDGVEHRIVFFDVLPDGRLLVVQGSEEEYGPAEIHVVQNFFEEIHRRVAAEK